MSENTLFIVLFFVLVLVSSILVFFYWRKKKIILIPAALWVSFLVLMTGFASVCLLDIPSGLTHISLYLLVIAFFITIIIFFCLAFIVPALLILDLVKKHDRKTSYYAWGVLWLWLTLMMTFIAYNKIRLCTFNTEGRNAQVLIDTLEAYNRKHNTYPKLLDQAMPGNMFNMYKTGMPAYPSIEYVPAKHERESTIYNSYKLILHCPIGVRGRDIRYMTRESAKRSDAHSLGEWRFIVLGDSFEYRPDQQYPLSIRDGSITKLGKWVYIRRYR